MRRALSLSLITLLAGSAAVQAADPVDVSPLITDRTLAVVRVDLTQIKIRSMTDWAVDTAKRAGAPVDLVSRIEKGASLATLLVQPMIDGLVRSGASRAVVLLQLAEPIAQPPVLLLAFDAPANPQNVTAALAPLNLRSGRAGKLMVFSPNLPPGVLAKMTPAARDDLSDATPAGKSPVVSAVVGVPEAARAEVAGFIPPRLDALTRLTRDVKQYAVNVDLSAGPRVSVTAVATSPEAAAAIQKLAVEPRTDPLGRMWGELARLMSLSVDGPTITAFAGQSEIDAAAKRLLPPLNAAKTAADSIKSTSNLKQLVLAIQMYANEHNDMPPATLADLGKEFAQADNRVPAEILSNPRRPEFGTSGYVYIPIAGKTTDLTDPSGRIALYEAGEFGTGINVAYWDGRVVAIKDPAEFRQQLKAAGVVAP